MKKHFYSISYKLLLTLVAGTTIPMLIYCLFFYFDMRRSSENAYVTQARQTWRIVSNNIEHSLSTSIYAANQGIYLNSALQTLLFSRDGSLFSHAESANSSLLFSYMTNIYSMTPEAVQIQFSAYKPGKSFLLTTKNLQKYLLNRSFEEDTASPVPPFQAYIEPPHRQTNYGHQISHLSLSQSEELMNARDLVFTICLPIYDPPLPDEPIGILHVDISMDFFKDVCGDLYQPEENFYIVDSDSHIIFSSDAALIGKKAEDAWVKDLVSRASEQSGAFIWEKGLSSLLFCQQVPGSAYEWYMIKSIPESLVYQSSNRQLAVLLVAFALCLFAAILINGGSILRYTTPLKKATDYLNGVKSHARSLDDRLSDYVSYQKEDEIGVLFRSLEEMMDQISNFIIRQYELEIINRTTELKMLEAQINPHFIYNTLQCLATNSLAHNDREQYDYISSFGQLMQYSMDTQRTLVTVQEELSHIERYVKLQKMRFPNHLTFSIEAGDAIRKITVPKMILQPLIENSFKHGSLLKRQQGLIRIQASLEKERFLHLYIADNGKSPSQEQLLRINRRLGRLRKEYIHKLISPRLLSAIDRAAGARPAGEGDIHQARENLYAANNIGLANVLMRLLLNFGEECFLEISANELGGTTIHLFISYTTLWRPEDGGKNNGQTRIAPEEERK